MVGGDRCSALEGLTIRVGTCWALAEDGAPGPLASVASPLLRLGHLEAQETWASRETPANTYRAGLDGRLLSSGAVWWRSDVDEDRRWAWLSANALSAKSGPCGGRSRATTGAICVSSVITKPGLQTSKPSAKPVVRPGTRELPQRPTCRSGSTGTWQSPRHVGGAGDVSVRRRTLWSCDDGGVCAMQGSPSGGLTLTVCQGSTMGRGARGPSRRAR